jgi:hypothetical protein
VLAVKRATALVLIVAFLYLVYETGANHNLTAGWLLFVAGSIVAIVQGVRFRRREPYLVAMYRFGMPFTGMGQTLTFLSIPFGLLFLAWLLIAGFVASTSDLAAWPHWARSIAVWGSFSYLFIVMGASLIASYAEPRWMLPRWLQEEKARPDYRPRPRDWFDRLKLIGAVLFIVAGLLAAYSGVLGTQGVRGL